MEHVNQNNLSFGKLSLSMFSSNQIESSSNLEKASYSKLFSLVTFFVISAPMTL
ncbi:hypothetical protein JCM18904_4309 [Vibrio sp. JCM 18904]|nr:hypothetical protein JCM18904_4309 [Vibrio sp. JCM 18904]